MDEQLSNHELTQIGDILKDRFNNNVINDNNGITYNVNNVDKEILNNVSNVNTSKVGIKELVEELVDKPEALAKEIANKLGDTKNLNFHLRVVKANEPAILFESLAIALAAVRDGKVFKSKVAAYYVGVLKRKGVHW